MRLDTPEPVVVTAYGLWDAEQPKMGHFIEVADPANPDDKYRYSLDKDAAIEVPAIGTLVRLAVRFFHRAEARNNRNGEPYVYQAEKRRVIGLKAA